MSQTSVRLIDLPRVEGSTSDVNAQSPQEPQADQTTADAAYQARHCRRSVAQNPLLNYPLGKINRSTLPSQVIRFSEQKLHGLIPDCCRISLRGNRGSRKRFCETQGLSSLRSCGRQAAERQNFFRDSGKLAQGLLDFVSKRLKGREGVQMRILLFHLLPKLLNGMVVRRIRRQLADLQPCRLLGEDQQFPLSLQAQ